MYALDLDIDPVITANSYFYVLGIQRVEGSGTGEAYTIYKFKLNTSFLEKAMALSFGGRILGMDFSDSYA